MQRVPALLLRLLETGPVRALLFEMGQLLFANGNARFDGWRIRFQQTGFAEAGS